MCLAAPPLRQPGEAGVDGVTQEHLDVMQRLEHRRGEVRVPDALRRCIPLGSVVSGQSTVPEPGTHLRPDCPGRSRHSWPRVPDSTGIGSNPQLSAGDLAPRRPRNSPANRPLFAPTKRGERGHRTQEGGGSSPPSSIVTETRSLSGFFASWRGPCTGRGNPGDRLHPQ
jgi:hypothetical protein